MGKQKPRTTHPPSEPQSHGVGLRVQNMPFPDQTLVIARLVEARTGTTRFTAQDINSVFIDSSLPRPKNPHDVLGKLRDKGLLTIGVPGTFSITPLGRHRSLNLISNIDLAAFSAESALTNSVLGHVPHTVVPPELAPPKLIPALQKFLAQHPFETNVFGMTRFPEKHNPSDPDPVQPALDAAREACRLHGLEFHLASDRAIDDDLWTNVAAHMWASKYGIAFFENTRARGLNYNLTIEVGSMLITGRRCALLKDSSLPNMPTDLVGQIYKSVNLKSPDTVKAALHTWLSDDIGLGKCKECPSKK